MILIRLKPRKDTQLMVAQFRSTGFYLEFWRYDALTGEAVFIARQHGAANSR